MVRLPTQYQEVEYLESTGTQYIDTGLTTERVSRLHYDCKVAFTEKPNKTTYFSGADYGFFFGVSSDNKIFVSRAENAVYDYNLNQPYNMSIDFEVTGSMLETLYEIQGLGGGSWTRETRTDAAYRIGIFVLYRKGGNIYAGSIVKGRVFSFKITKNGELVRDFIPCYRKSDNVAGMYDLVSNQFFTNAGTGEFILGPAISTPYNLLLQRRAMMLAQPRLPWTYQEVEYLESTGTQYIDMTYSYVVDDEIECSFSVDQSTGAIQGIFGNGNNAGGLTYNGTVLYMNNERILTSTIGGLLGNQFYKWNSPITFRQKYNVRYIGRDVYADGTKVLEVANILQNGTQSDFSLFRRWGTNTMVGKMYGFSIKRNGTDIHNFIPCYRKSDNVAGMYDLVSKTFFTNAGTGDFLVGADVK